MKKGTSKLLSSYTKAAIFLLAAIGLVTTFKSQQSRVAQVSAETSVTESYVIGANSDVSTQDGTVVSSGSGNGWIGTGGDANNSYLGLRFTGTAIPVGAKIDSAKLELVSTSSQWIPVRAKVFASFNDTAFSNSSKPGNREGTALSVSINENVSWAKDGKYTYDVTGPVREAVSQGPASAIVLVAKGEGSAWGRKFIYTNPTSGKSPKLVITYSTSGSGPTITPTRVPGSTTAPTNTPTRVPTATSTPRPNSTSPTTAPTATMSMPMATNTPLPAGGNGSIFGTVSADVLGSCSAAVHDRFVTQGPDGRLYRTWHPGTVPVDPNSPNGAKCTFAHEHGDDPSTSRVYNGTPVPFGFIAAQLNPPMDEPHPGFKCFVTNKGIVNDEGTTALHDSFSCFHMGTGGTARFAQRFHSLAFNMRTESGYVMRLQGMADVGNVGTICNNPRQARTVMGFGCRLDSAYEIWENTLRINNRGSTVATSVVSTAVFDPITVMDPADTARVVYAWTDEAQQKIFKFVNNRTSFRGCDRESYHGPVQWFNRGGTTTYFTDAYGSVVNGGPLKQEISTINTSNNTGFVDQYGALVMGYKGGNVSQSQFKYTKSHCFSGLGTKN